MAAQLPHAGAEEPVARVERRLRDHRRATLLDRPALADACARPRAAGQARLALQGGDVALRSSAHARGGLEPAAARKVGALRADQRHLALASRKSPAELEACGSWRC